MNDNLILINKYKMLIDKYSNYLLIFLRKYYSLKDRLENILFENSREMYIINSLSDKSLRHVRKEELLGNIKYLNYLFISINKLDILNDKQYKVLYISLEEIYKCLIGWIKIDK